LSLPYVETCLAQSTTVLNRTLPMDNQGKGICIASPLIDADCCFDLAGRVDGHSPPLPPYAQHELARSSASLSGGVERLVPIQSAHGDYDKAAGTAALHLWEKSLGFEMGCRNLKPIVSSC
jgi:hypothetical protein